MYFAVDGWWFARHNMQVDDTIAERSGEPSSRSLDRPKFNLRKLLLKIKQCCAQITSYK